MNGKSLNLPRAISRVTEEQKTNVSDTNSLDIIKIEVYIACLYLIENISLISQLHGRDV
jgi:hypothetical protein